MASSILCSALGKPVTSSWFRKIGRIKTQKKVCLLVYVFLLTNQDREDCPPCGQLQMAGALRANTGTSWDPCLRQTHNLQEHHCHENTAAQDTHADCVHRGQLVIFPLPFLSLPNTIPIVYADFFLGSGNFQTFSFSPQFLLLLFPKTQQLLQDFFLHSWYWACFLCLFSTI